MKDLSKLSANQIFSIDTRGKPMTKTTFYNQITKNINIGNNLTNIASIGFYKAGQLLVKAKKELKGEFGKLKKELAQSGLHIKQQERYMKIARNKNIQLKSHGIGKFGRCLGEIFLDMVDGQEKLTLESLNKLLIKEGHAVEYHGGKR